MAVPSPRRTLDADDEPRATSLEDAVSMHTTCPGRRVFVEDGNTDAWIATDLTVSLDR